MKRTISFKNSAGHNLSGTLITPSGAPPYPVVIFSHGLYSGKFSPRNLEVANELVKAGVACFLFDFTGHGESEGTLEQSTLEQQLDDLGAAIDLLTGLPEIDRQRIGINGSSSGGTVAIIRAAGDRRLKALVLRSPRTEEAIKAAYLLSAPTLIIAGEKDSVVVEECKALQGALGGEKRLELIAGAGHLFERPEQMKQVIKLSVDWFIEKLLEPGVAKAA